MAHFLAMRSYTLYSSNTKSVIYERKKAMDLTEQRTSENTPVLTVSIKNYLGKGYRLITILNDNVFRITTYSHKHVSP